MGCGCQKSKRQFEVVKGDGSKVIVDSRVEAIRLAQATQGKWHELVSR